MLRDEMITVFGGSGFVGRYVVRRLVKAGYRVRVATRRPHLAHELKPMGVVGQIQLVQANLRNRASVERAVDGAHGVVNLVGILFQAGRQSFSGLQAQGPRVIAEAAKVAGVTRFVQISAIGADPDSDSLYARSKAEGEAAVREVLPEAVILRPSIIFGSEDAFFNKFADMARFAPALPLIGGGKTRFQPVYADDVAEAVLAVVQDKATPGQTYELGGPEVYTFKELMAYVLKTIRRRRFLAPIPFPVAHLMGFGGEVAGRLPFVEPFLTRDQVALLKTDNVVSEGAKGLDDLGIQAETIGSIVPSYLYRYRKGGQFSEETPGY